MLDVLFIQFSQFLAHEIGSKIHFNFSFYLNLLEDMRSMCLASLG